MSLERMSGQEAFVTAAVAAITTTYSLVETLTPNIRYSMVSHHKIFLRTSSLCASPSQTKGMRILKVLHTLSMVVGISFLPNNDLLCSIFEKL